MNWVEVSLTVNGELAEAVADVLARSAPSGVTTEQSVDYFGDEDEGTPVGPITVRAYLPADEKLEETRQKLEEGLFYLGMIQPLPAATYTPIADQNWMEAWKEHYHPIPVGKKLIIVPAWLDSPDSARVAIKIDPGMAFGTGTHPSTQLCLEFIEKTCTDLPEAELAGMNAIDVGCGSGILSIGALKLGMGFALGVDIDAASVKASRENADTNGIAAESFAIGLGSVTEILEGKFPIQQAHLVLANILAPVIIRLFGMGLADLVAPGGVLVLAGILAEQAEAVQVSAEQHGLKLVEKRQMGDWVALKVVR
jgi:ribosomal protein L11 methyltransferase